MTRPLEPGDPRIVMRGVTSDPSHIEVWTGTAWLRVRHLSDVHVYNPSIDETGDPHAVAQIILDGPLVRSDAT